MEVICVKEGNDYIQANYPNDPLLKHVATNLLDQLPKAEIPRWIPVTERMPDTVGGSYLVAIKYKYAFEKEFSYDTDVATYNPYEGGYIGGCWDTWNDWDEGQEHMEVTHWMELPEPPKEVANG